MTTVTAPPVLVPLALTPVVTIDLETTGFDFAKCEPVEFAAVRTVGGVETDTYTTLIRPACGDTGAEHIHRISNAMVADAPTFADVAGKIIEVLRGAIIVAHNAKFDIGHMRASFGRAGLDWPEPPVLGTLEGARHRMPGLGSYKLGSLAEHLGIDLQGAHAAAADTRAASRLFDHLARMTPDLRVHNPDLVIWPQVDIVSEGKPR